MVCKKICNECPFSNTSAKGWLADYTTEDFKTFMNNEALFPCHMQRYEDGMTQIDVEDEILHGGMRICRGYVESMIKSCKMPKSNDILIEVREQVKLEGLSEQSMPIWEFIKHHTID